MIRTGTIEKAREGREHHVLPNGTGYWRNRLITSAAREIVAPQAFLVEQEPNTLIEPHFHQENEFQVVVAGSGALGRHDVGPVSVHYAGAHTGYGPITAGSEGLSYFTLRARTDPGAQFLPGARDKMQRGPKRHVLGEPVAPAAAEELAALKAARTIDIWQAQPDGVGAWLLRVPPGMPVQAPTPAAARYLLVIGGVLLLNGERLPRFATAFVGDENPELRAGNEGLELLVLQFPFKEEKR